MYDAPRWHALLNDLPAALLLAAVLFDIAGAVFKRESLHWAGIWALWTGVIGGWAEVVAGELGEEARQHGEAKQRIMEGHGQKGLVTMRGFTVRLVWEEARVSVQPSQ